MKQLLLLSLAIIMTLPSFSQSNKEEIDLIQAAFGMEKKAIVANFVKPSDAQKDAFWKLYDAYETERKELGKQRLDLLVQYGEQYMKMTSEQADAWTKEVIELQKKTDKLIGTYYHKIKGVSDGLVATQFYQIENYILATIRLQVLHEVPFVVTK